MTSLSKLAGVIRLGAVRMASQRLWLTKFRRPDEKTPHRLRKLPYQPEAWRDVYVEACGQELQAGGRRAEVRSQRLPDIREQTRVLELLGRVNYKIIQGNKVYVEVGGVVYKTLYGGYWRSVFTGIEHYLLRCEQVSGSVWAEDEDEGAAVDLPVSYSNEGWTASGHSLSFMLSRE